MGGVSTSPRQVTTEEPLKVGSLQDKVGGARREGGGVRVEGDPWIKLKDRSEGI